MPSFAETLHLPSFRKIKQAKASYASVFRMTNFRFGMLDQIILLSLCADMCYNFFRSSEEAESWTICFISDMTVTGIWICWIIIITCIGISFAFGICTSYLLLFCKVHVQALGYWSTNINEQPTQHLSYFVSYYFLRHFPNCINKYLN